jgi:hypothetical protein
MKAGRRRLAFFLNNLHVQAGKVMRGHPAASAEASGQTQIKAKG